MRFAWTFWRMPDNKALLTRIETAAISLCEKFSGLDVESLEISEYGKKRLGLCVKNLRKLLPTYIYHLVWALHDTGKPLQDCVLLNYGGGIGLLSMLAKEAGVGIVVYNDIFDVSCRDAEAVAKRIGNIAEYYIQGEMSEVGMYLRGEKVSCDAVVSYGAIEHIYDLKAFCNGLADLTAANLSLALGSSANPHNPFISRKITKLQHRLETTDRKKEYGHREVDCLVGYFKARSKIIAKTAPQLPVDVIDRLSYLTRGLKESDIRRQVHEYVATGVLPKGPDHPTNTCDPYTGDRKDFADANRLKSFLSNVGFSTQVMPGFHGSLALSPKRIVSFLNAIIRFAGGNALWFAPFFVVRGKKS